MLEITVPVGSGRSASYIDNNDQVYIRLTGGDRVSTDNTCRMHADYDKCRKDIIAELDRRIEDFTTLSHATTSPHALTRIQRSLEKLSEQRYLVLQILPVMDTETLLSRLLHHTDINVTSVLLAPMVTDYVVRQQHHHLKLNRTMSGESLSQRLREALNPEAIVQSRIAQQSTQFQFFLSLLAAIRELPTNSNGKLPYNSISAVISLTHERLVQHLEYTGTPATLEFIALVNSLDGDETFDPFELAELVVNAFQLDPSLWIDKDGIFTAICGKLAIIQNKVSKNYADQRQIRNLQYRLHGLIQLVIGVSYSYLREQHVINRMQEFGHHIDNMAFISMLVEQLHLAFNTGNSIFECVLMVIFETNVFRVTSKPSQEDIHEIRSRFYQIARTVHEAPHYDEFLITESRAGPVAVLDYGICVKLPEVVAIFKPDLYSQHYVTGRTLERYPQCQQDGLHATSSSALEVTISAKTINEACGHIRRGLAPIDKLIALLNLIPTEHFQQLVIESQIHLRTIIGNVEQLMLFHHKLEITRHRLFILVCPRIFQIHVKTLEQSIHVMQHASCHIETLNAIIPSLSNQLTTFESLQTILENISQFVPAAHVLNLLLQFRGNLDGIVTTSQQLNCLSINLSLDHYALLMRRLPRRFAPMIWNAAAIAVAVPESSFDTNWSSSCA